VHREQDSYWKLFWRTGLPEAYVMSCRSRTGEKRPDAPERKEKRGG
jgi:hypothetical protein